MFTRKTDTKPDDAAREALRRRVHPSPPCWACGAPAGSLATVTTRTALNGDLIGFGADVECAHSTDLDRDAAARVLDIAPTDPALDGITVTRYADTLPTPRRCSEPWEHLDAGELAAQVMANRDDITRRTGGPCTACGLSVLPPGDDIGWTTTSRGLRCPSCDYRLGGRDSSPTLDEQRAMAVAQLVGLCDGERRMLNRTLSNLVAFWSDGDHEPGGATPWRHVDAAELAREVERLASSGYLRTPPKWSPARRCRTW